MTASAKDSASKTPAGEVAAYLDMPPERRALAKAHAALLSETAGRVALELPIERRCRRLPPRAGDEGQAMTDLAELSARALAKAIRDKKVSSVGGDQSRHRPAHGLPRADQLHHHARGRRGACRRAKAADAAIANGSPRAARRRAAGPQGHVRPQGQDRRAGAPRSAPDKPAAEDATAIARFKAAGALQIAALHLTEFAYGPTGHNYVLGHARNPWDPTRITGGSSGGTAAAVAYGAIPAGLGSDTGGSLRVPAACCGVTSIKPTWGRVSRAGAMPLAPQLDTVGVIARHVEDLALMLGLLAGPDPRDPVGLDAAGARLRRPARRSRAGPQGRRRREGHRRSAPRRAAHGRAGRRHPRQARPDARRPAAFPDWQTLDHLVQLVQLPDAARRPRRLPAHAPGRLRPAGARSRVEVGHFIPAVDHLTALRARGTYVAAHARRDLQGHRHRHPADPGRSAADDRRARRRRRAEAAGGDGPGREVHAPRSTTSACRR